MHYRRRNTKLLINAIAFSSIHTITTDGSVSLSNTLIEVKKNAMHIDPFESENFFCSAYELLNVANPVIELLTVHFLYYKHQVAIKSYLFF